MVKSRAYCVRSVILRWMIIFASGETSYCSRTVEGLLMSTFLNSGSLAAFNRISLIISASFCRDAK